MQLQFRRGTSWRNWAKSWFQNGNFTATWLCIIRIHHKIKVPTYNKRLEANLGWGNRSDRKSTSGSTRTWTHQTHRTQICHTTVTRLRLISNACVHYLDACVRCFHTCVTYFWDAWVFALILEVPDSFKVENREGITSTSTWNGTIFFVILELTNIHAFMAFPDDSTSFLSHNKSWKISRKFGQISLFSTET